MNKKVMNLVFLFIILGSVSWLQAATGDANNNGTIDIVDAMVVAQYSSGLPVNINMAASDVNCDSNVNINDALLIARYSAGLVSQFCSGTISPSATPTPTISGTTHTTRPTVSPVPYSTKLRVNQAGYDLDDNQKTAVAAGLSGSFSVCDYYTNQSVFTGTMTSLGTDSGNGESLYQADFSNLKQSGVYYLKVGSEKSARFVIASDVYNEVLYYTLRVYGANRCGNYDSWIHEPCHLKDGSIRGTGKDGTLTGGWHDCGDHVKFGGTLGYAAVMILYSYMAWPGAFQDVYSMTYSGTYYSPQGDGIPDPLNEAKVATDYMLNLYKASAEDGLIASNKMYYQVGDGDDDHSWWHKPENQDAFGQAKGGAPREVYSDIGADIAGRYAASLAMMSILYKQYDSTYAADCLTAAKAIYKLGANNYGKGGDAGGKGYYQPDGRMDDDMAVAGIMLYKATNDDYYINNTTGAQYWMAVEQKWQFVSYYVLSFPNIFAIALHAYYPYASTTDSANPSDIGTKVVTRQECADWLKLEINSSAPAADIYGRKFGYSWGTCRYVMGVAATACMAHDLNPTDASLLKVAKDQLNWVFGRNQFSLSFVIGNTNDGWLTKYPQHPHHRAANPDGKNVPELPAYAATELTGATIGGPTGHTAFGDVWDNYQATETGVDYWAGTFFTSAYLIYNKTR